ncbi:leucine-rich repeat-containing protein 41-like isoform X3 [Lineus longissimus]|uniref:leucine-rich repeat-containing protein 41-like isoform X3 n=1 Tax=Lineus longissimus TaxID=88925 RepID=UPI002B4E483E
MAHLLLVLKHDQGLRRLTWHNAHKILNEEFTSAMETLADVNRLEYLEIKFLLISCKEREEALIKVISNATNLRVLNLSDCDLQHQLVLSDGFIEALASSNIRELCLSENKLGNKVLTAITRVLKAQQPNIKLTSIDISENCIDVDGLLEFAESLGTVMSNHSHSTILRKLTADYNVRSCEEQEIVLKVFSALVREISVKGISNYSNFAEFEAQM